MGYLHLRWSDYGRRKTNSVANKVLLRPDSSLRMNEAIESESGNCVEDEDLSTRIIEAVSKDGRIPSGTGNVCCGIKQRIRPLDT